MTRIVLHPAGGGLGNLLLQHHALYALARDANQDRFYVYGDYQESARPRMQQAYAELFRHITFVSGPELEQMARSCSKPPQTYKEPEFRHRPIVCHDAEMLIIYGYFQSYKYFARYTREIREQLRQNEADTFAQVRADYNAICGSAATTVMVHIRRGDYLNLAEYHTVLPREYYMQALAQMQSTHGPCRFLIFAEDIQEVQDPSWMTEVWRDNDVVFVNEPDPLRTFFMMSLCEHFIIANSSLSLNGYYMREHDTSTCIAPAAWFGPKGPAFDIRDIVPPEAIVLAL